MVPLGQRTLGTNDGTFTVSLPKETVKRLGMEKGDDFDLGYHAGDDEFRVQEAEDFEGWD